MRRLGRWRLLAPLLFWPAPAAASYLAAWLPDYGLVARIGNEFISSYDVAVEVIINRSLRGTVSDAPPDQNERSRAAARILSRLIVLDAVKRSASVVPDANRIASLEKLVLGSYGQSPAKFEAQTGLDLVKLKAELTQRAVVDAYLRDVLLPSLRAGGSAAVTSPLDQLQILEQLKAEILRLRERFMERQKVEILDPSYSLDKLLQLEDAFASM